MPDQSSVNDVFRFIQLRPKRPPSDAPSIPLLDNTPLAKSLISAPTNPARIRLADAALKGHTDTVRSLDEIPLGAEIVAALHDLSETDDATNGDLLARLPNAAALLNKPQFTERGAALSNTLLSAFFATQGFPEDLKTFQAVHRVYHLLRQKKAGDAESSTLLTDFLKRPILSPSVSRTDSSARRDVPSVGPKPKPALATGTANVLATAIEELARHDRPEHLVQPSKAGMANARGDVPFTLTAAARKRISKQTLSVLDEHGIDLTTTPIDAAVHVLDGVRGTKAGVLLDWPAPVVTTDPGVTLPPAPAQALVRPAGVADLLVVKQQIKRYEAGEIAHVENVLIGEKKSRAHRQLDRFEETITTDKETTRVHETELETADRFELNRETSQTIKEDQQIGANLSLSGKYGPSVEFSSSFDMSINTSNEESTKNSSRYAKDVMNRSLDRVTERVREQRTQTTIRETEETNLHELENKTANHVRGVYQFIDKVYEAQVFNYGIREIFDFMVPEPASFLWHVEQHPTLDVTLPPPPPKLDLIAPDARYISEDNAPALAAAYGALDIEGAPPLYKRLTTGFKHGTDNASEADQPHNNDHADVQIPAGYRPWRAQIIGLAFTDENPVIAVAIGGQHVVWKPSSADRVALSDGKKLAHEPELFLDLSYEPYELSDAKIGVSIMAWETNTFTLDIRMVVQRSDEELARWKLATYKKIRTAYDDRVTQYNQQVAELRAAAEAKAEQDTRRPFGAPPAENSRTINTELKKHCISIITQQRYDAFDATKDGTPPFFDFTEAAAEGAYIRFFEQAFEWDQLQYVFYPYFWARKASWIDRFVKQDVDPNFVDFLRAGAARVVVPARPGFEVAVTHFLETGKIWGGDGEPPEINSPLYVSIVDEIRERTGAPQGEIPVGDPWDVRVPTALVIVRSGGTLPEWERVAPGVWSWAPVAEA
jgi:hypothetical protein